MTGIVEAALPLWDLAGARYELVAERENAVYRVTAGSRFVAMRLHRVGYRSDIALRSELAWMAQAARAGISVPDPIPMQAGGDLAHVSGVQVDVLSWLPGTTLTERLTASADQTAVFHALGREMARLHAANDAWDDRPAWFERVAWDMDGLIGSAPVWDRFWENPALSAQDRALFEQFRQVAIARLTTLGDSLDYGLIHADLVADNVLVNDAGLHLIDFDDGGFGYRLFDVATALLKHRERGDYPDLEASLIDGYQTVRPLDLQELDLFLALRACTYVGWNITRMDEPKGQARNARFVETARQLIMAYLR